MLCVRVVHPFAFVGSHACKVLDWVRRNTSHRLRAGHQSMVAVASPPCLRMARRSSSPGCRQSCRAPKRPGSWCRGCRGADRRSDYRRPTVCSATRLALAMGHQIPTLRHAATCDAACRSMPSLPCELQAWTAENSALAAVSADGDVTVTDQPVLKQGLLAALHCLARARSSNMRGRAFAIAILPAGSCGLQHQHGNQG